MFATFERLSTPICMTLESSCLFCRCKWSLSHEPLDTTDGCMSKMIVPSQQFLLGVRKVHVLLKVRFWSWDMDLILLSWNGKFLDNQY